MRPLFILLFTFFYHHTCPGQSTANASVSVTILPSEDVASVQNIVDELLTWKVEPTTTAKNEFKKSGEQLVFRQNAVITSFEIGTTHGYSVSLPEGVLTMQKLKGAEILQFSAFRLAALQINEQIKTGNAKLEATIKGSAKPSAGVYISQSDLEVTIHLN